MGWITAIAGIFSALVKLLSLAKEAYIAWKTIQHNKKTEKIIDAVNSGDTIEVEIGLGNPDAGKHSGIGEVRPKKK